MTTYYVDPAGSDSNDGSQDSPWLTLSHAITNSVQGDTIHLNAGAYTLTEDTAYSYADRIIEGDGAGSTILDGGGFSMNFTVSGTGNEINHLSITNCVQNVQVPTFALSTNAVLEVAGVEWHDITISIPGNQNGGGLWSAFNKDSATITFLSCIFHNFREISGGDFKMLATTRNATNITANYNNCTFIFETTGADEIIEIYGFSDGITSTFTNCILYKAAGVTSAAVQGSWSNSCFFGDWTSIPTGSGNINQDPLFVDLANDDFRLRQGSPCLDAGTVL